ncbi:MAG TPA: TonB-dependent receptor, partial [Candidatus Sulfopaludibacter sp.]|nr:TonB-dependent receptor [Candidatus Sulfopaludibacter sp.]
LLDLSAMKASAAAPAPKPQAAAPGAAQTAANAPAAAVPAAGNGKKPAKGKGPAVPQQTGSFQRAEVNASGNGAAAPGENVAPADAAGANDSMIVNGSVSNGIERRAIGNNRRGPGSMYRGDLFGVLDSSVLNAQQFSLTGQATPQPYYNDMRFGGSFGGPLTIPHLLHGNGQFFINYQMTRNRNANTASALMPTPDQRNGDFSQLVNLAGQFLPIVDPATGHPFPGNIIPQSRISPQAAYLLKWYPLPNFIEAAGYNYQVPQVNVTNQNDVSGRINRTLSRKDFLYGGFGYRNQDMVSPSIFNFNDTTNVSGMSGNANWRHMFNQRVNSTFGVQYSRYTVHINPYFAYGDNVSHDAGITGNNQDPINYGPPSLNFVGSSTAGLSDTSSSLIRNQTVGFSYTGLWVHRPHNITYGFDIRRQQFNNVNQQNPRGTFTFTGAAAGYDFAGFLLGIPDASAIAYGNADKYFRANMDDAYITDDWRIAAGFSVNIGVRWEYGSPIVEKYGRLVNLDVAPGYTAVAPVIGYSPTGTLTGMQYPASLVNPDKHAFQPRLAFSWHPLFGSSVVVRGGYGVYYNTGAYTTIATQMAQQSPLSKSLSVSNSPANPLTLANGFNTTPGVTPNTFAIDPNFRVGYTQNWQLSVQKDLTEGIVMTVTYLGIKGTRGMQVFVPNTYPEGVANPCSTCPSGYKYLASNGNSTREAGQLQIMRRFHNGFSATALYTYSKAIDDSALLGGGGSGPGSGGGNALIAQDWLNLAGERGLSNFDQRHLLTLNAQYTTGVGVRGGTLLSGWRGTAFKGWTFINQLKIGTGFPETPSYPAALGLTGVTGPVRPDYTGQPLYTAPPGLFLNPAAFTAPVGHWGDAARNMITGPAVFSMDSSMARTFKENLDLRFDATNTLNHVTFTSWNATTTSPQFGLPLAANKMRVFQVTLRWRF